MSLAEQRGLRTFALCALYVAQGIPWGFMATTLPAYLTQRGLDAGFVTATLSFTYLPYSFKWIWGPVIDAVPLGRLGRRRPWILLAQALMAGTVLAMVWFDVTAELELLAWMVFLHTTFNALQDVAVDALAVDLLDDDERGRANGLMYASKYGGGLVGGLIMAEVVHAAGLDAALVAQTAILLAIMLVPLLVRERAVGGVAASSRPPRRELLALLGQAFSLRSSLVAVVLMLAMNVSSGLLSAVSYPLFIHELHWTYNEFARLSGGGALAVGGLVAVGTGFVVDRFGRRAVAAFAAWAMAAGWVAFALLEPHWSVRELVWASSLYQTACQGMLSVALVTMCMDLSWERVGGTQFTVYMALSNFSTVLGQQFAARALALWEFYGIYLIAAALQVAASLLLLAIDPRQLRARLPLARVNRLGIAAVVALLGFLVAMTIRASAKYL